MLKKKFEIFFQIIGKCTSHKIYHFNHFSFLKFKKVIYFRLPRHTGSGPASRRLRFVGFSLRRVLLLWSAGSRLTGSVVAGHKLS